MNPMARRTALCPPAVIRLSWDRQSATEGVAGAARRPFDRRVRPLRCVFVRHASARPSPLRSARAFADGFRGFRQRSDFRSWWDLAKLEWRADDRGLKTLLAAHLFNSCPQSRVCQVATVPGEKIIDPVGGGDGDVCRIDASLG